MKVIQCMCVTLSSKVNRQGHGFVFNIFDILDLENVRIDTKINFVSCLQPEIWKVMQKGVWPWFSRSYNKDGIFSLSPLDSLTPKTYPWEIFPKNSDGKTKIQGGGWYPPPPPGRPKVDFYLGHLRCCRTHCRNVSTAPSLFFGSSFNSSFAFFKLFSSKVHTYSPALDIPTDQTAAMLSPYPDNFSRNCEYYISI